MSRKVIWSLSLIVIVTLMLTACGAPATPAPKAEPTKAPAAAPAATAAPAAKAEPTKAPAAAEPTKAPAPTAAPAAKAAEPTKAAAAAPAAATGKYKESPMLTDLVKAGKLPPIDQRVPEQPFVVDKGTLITEKDLPDWQPGKFGGTLNFAHAVANWNPDIFIGDNDNLLCAPGIGLEGLKPCLLSDFKVSPDNKEFTFTLRKGLKWSDGTPVTTEDVRFTWEDIYGNEKLTPVFPEQVPGRRQGGRQPGQARASWTT